MKSFWRLTLVGALIALIVIQNVQQTNGLKKKLMLKKLKKMLPLLLAIKPKKKIIILPLPIPMGTMSKLGGGWGNGGGMHIGGQMPIHSMPQPLSAGLDQSWTMMNAMDCTSDFYGMGNALSSDGGWGGGGGIRLTSDGWGGGGGSRFISQSNDGWGSGGGKILSQSNDGWGGSGGASYGGLKGGGRVQQQQQSGWA